MSITAWEQFQNSMWWRPSRPAPDTRLHDLEVQFQRVRRQVKKINTSGGSPVIVGGSTPLQLLSIQATQEPFTQVDRSYSQISVSFTRDPKDANYDHARVWLLGYKGNSVPVLCAQNTDSPVVFNEENTGEQVVVIVQAVSPSGHASPLSGCPRTTLNLAGPSAPPAPSVSQQTATITSGGVTVGQQFAFNLLSASTAYALQGYWIYRVGSHVAPTPPAGRYHFVPANQNQGGTFTFSDPSGVSTNFFYVSAVDKGGNESSLTDCFGGSGGTTTTYRPTTSTAVKGGGFSNPSNVWDGNFTTYSNAASPYGGNIIEEKWQGFASATGTNTTTLYISCSGSGTNSLSYSINGGSTFTSLSVPSSQATVSASIPVATNLSNIVIDAQVNPPGVRTGAVGALKIYEIYVQTT